ncbi:uncharacterized protein LOC120350249 [Nilaparvata lugens]|nr:uncharacterized protein LOC120350249 [Nilaparvata lugens]
MPPKQRKQYSDEMMHEAILAVRGGESISCASKRLGVPRMTLSDKLSGRTPQVCKLGRKMVLSSDEEDVLVQWVLSCQTSGLPINSDQLIESIKTLVEKLGKETPFTEDMPGKRWLEIFLKRHPEISVRKPQKLTLSRSSITPEALENWFKEVKEYMTSHGLLDILDDWSRIYNCDESAFFCHQNK